MESNWPEGELDLFNNQFQIVTDWRIRKTLLCMPSCFWIRKYAKLNVKISEKLK